MSKDNKGKFFLFTMIAAIFGYLAGILTAPKSGKETRGDIAHKAGEVKAEAVDKLRIAENELDGLVRRVQEKADEFSGKAKAEFSTALSKAKDAQAKAKIMAKAVKEGRAENKDLDSALKDTKKAIANLSKFLKN